MTNRKPKPERQPMPELVEVVNATGEKQTIPSAWLSHPVLSVGFRLPPSTRGVWAAPPVAPTETPAEAQPDEAEPTGAEPNGD
jgi:hypothetical protein